MTDIVNTAVQPSTFATYLIYGLAVGAVFAVNALIRKFCKIYALGVVVDLITALLIGGAFLFFVNYRSNGVMRVYMLFAYTVGALIDVAVYKTVVKIALKVTKRDKG